MATLRSKVIRLAQDNPELRPQLLPLVTKVAGRGSWSRETITIPTRTGEETMAATVKDNWAVHKSLGGGGWTITWVPEGLLMKAFIKTKAMAVAIMEAVGERAPAIWTARTQGDVRRHQADILDVLRNPPEVKGRGGKPRKPKPLALDFAGILSSEGLANQGSRYGKAGEFWGVAGNGRMISLGRRDIMRNVFFVEVLHGGPRLGSRWNNAEIEYKSKMTEDRLRKWAKWAKGGYTTKELRQLARESDSGMVSGSIARR